MRVDLSSLLPLMLNDNDDDDDDDDTKSSENYQDMATLMTHPAATAATTALVVEVETTKPTRCPTMLSMKIIQLDRCQEKSDPYYYYYHHHPQGRYRGRSIVVEEEQVPVLSLRQKTSLFGILLMICQFATVDTYQLLPLGAILYAMGIGCALELILQEQHPDAEIIEFVLPWHERSPLQKKQEQQRRRQQQQQQQHYPTDEFLLERLQETVNFEYQVLQGFARAPQVVAREEAGTVVYYTV